MAAQIIATEKLKWRTSVQRGFKQSEQEQKWMEELKNLECLNIKTLLKQTNVDVMSKVTSEKAFDGRRLINYMIRIFEVMSMDFCDSMCL